MSDLLSRSEAKLASTPIFLAGADGVLFANADWTVSTDGLEHSNGYFIEREAVAQRRPDGAWVWPLHMAEKLWCAPDTFGEAFRSAVRAYGLAEDPGLVLAFAEALEAQGPAEAPPAYDLRVCPTGSPDQRQTGRSETPRRGVPTRLALPKAA